MGGVDNIVQQLHSIQMFRKTMKQYHKIFFRLLMMSLLCSHKLYKERGGNSDFVQFLHDVTVGIMANPP